MPETPFYAMHKKARMGIFRERDVFQKPPAGIKYFKLV